MSDSKELTLQNSFDNQGFLAVINGSGYPEPLKKSMTDVLTIIGNNKNLTDLYPEILAEIPVSTSSFQDTCVQYLQHYTPHKKLRQAVLEMQNKLEALYAAKTGRKETSVKLQKMQNEIDQIQYKLDKLISDGTWYDRTGAPYIIDDPKLKDLRVKELELEIDKKMVKLEDVQRQFGSSDHLIKDAMLKVVQQRTLVEKFQAEVAATGLSFEESEVVYYVLYFTIEAERQLRTGDHQVDRGSFMAISQLPDAIRNKVLRNISFLRQKLSAGYPIDGDFLTFIHYDELIPTKTGINEFEGLDLSDFIGYDPIKLLSKVEQWRFSNEKF